MANQQEDEKTVNQNQPQNETTEEQEKAEKPLSAYFEDDYRPRKPSLMGQLLGDVPPKEIYDEGSAEDIIEKRGPFKNPKMISVCALLMIAGIVLVFFFVKTVVYYAIFDFVFYLYWISKGYLGKKNFFWTLVAAAFAAAIFSVAAQYGINSAEGIACIAVGLVALGFACLYYYATNRLKKLTQELAEKRHEATRAKRKDRRSKKGSGPKNKGAFTVAQTAKEAFAEDDDLRDEDLALDDETLPAEEFETADLYEVAVVAEAAEAYDYENYEDDEEESQISPDAEHPY